MMARVLIERKALRAVVDALKDAHRELEAMEESHEWYTASPKVMDRLEKAVDVCADALRT